MAIVNILPISSISWKFANPGDRRDKPNHNSTAVVIVIVIVHPKTLN